MKVLFLTPWYPDKSSPHYGLFIRDQAAALAMKHEVVLVASNVDYDQFGIWSYSVAQSDFNGVKEHRLRIRRSIPFYNQLNYLGLSIWYTWKVARRFRPDIVHGNIGYPGAIWSWIIATFAGVPFVITEHSTWFSGNLRTPFHRWATLFFIRRSARIISVSRKSAADIFSYVKKDSVIIPNIIHIEIFERVTPAPSALFVQFGFLGGLDSNRKGLDILLNALSGIEEEYMLHIGGTGKLIESYKEQAERLGIGSKCKFYGMVPEGKVPEFMGRLHFFVSSSRAEGFGMVIAEAMASGLPVIATKSGGPEDFVVPETGLLIENEDVVALRDALLSMMRTYGSYDGSVLRRFVTDQFSKESVATAINEVYSNVLKAGEV